MKSSWINICQPCKLYSYIDVNFERYFLSCFLCFDDFLILLKLFLGIHWKFAFWIDKWWVMLLLQFVHTLKWPLKYLCFNAFRFCLYYSFSESVKVRILNRFKRTMQPFHNYTLKWTLKYLNLLFILWCARIDFVYMWHSISSLVTSQQFDRTYGAF